MDPFNLAERAVTFTRMSFDNAFKTVSLAQDQTRELSEKFLDLAKWPPAEEKQIFYECGESFRVHRDIYKRAVDEGFAKMDDFFSRPA